MLRPESNGVDYLTFCRNHAWASSFTTDVNLLKILGATKLLVMGARG